uniref:Cytochrome c oxidase subunit 7B, mitochondrial n=1 Tax=Sphenodon punctatus TaxID=8508 RepID=A0A8D0H764_SPHPU
MFPLVRSTLGLTARGVQQIAVRGAHRKYQPDFHDKYGNAVLVGGILFCAIVLAYVGTQIGLDWNRSPVGRWQNWRA